jgi:hypothetical protein
MALVASLQQMHPLHPQLQQQMPVLLHTSVAHNSSNSSSTRADQQLHPQRMGLVPYCSGQVQLPPQAQV